MHLHFSLWFQIPHVCLPSDVVQTVPVFLHHPGVIRSSIVLTHRTRKAVVRLTCEGASLFALLMVCVCVSLNVWNTRLIVLCVFPDSTDCMEYYRLGARASKSERFLSCNSTSLCVHPSWICDGANDCGDYADEIHCHGRNAFAFSLSICLFLVCLCSKYKIVTFRMENSTGNKENFYKVCTAVQWRLTSLLPFMMLWNVDFFWLNHTESCQIFDSNMLRYLWYM